MSRSGLGTQNVNVSRSTTDKVNVAIIHSTHTLQNRVHMAMANSNVVVAPSKGLCRQENRCVFR